MLFATRSCYITILYIVVTVFHQRVQSLQGDEQNQKHEGGRKDSRKNRKKKSTSGIIRFLASEEEMLWQNLDKLGKKNSDDEGTSTHHHEGCNSDDEHEKDHEGNESGAGTEELLPSDKPVIDRVRCLFVFSNTI